MGEIPIQCPITLMKSMTGRWARFVDRHPNGSLGVAVLGLFAVLAGVFLGALLIVS